MNLCHADHQYQLAVSVSTNFQSVSEYLFHKY
jgi:hypothetical protein